MNNVFDNGFNNHLSKTPLLPPTAAGRVNFTEGVDPRNIGFGDPFLQRAKLGNSYMNVKPGESVQEAINEIHDRGGGRVVLDSGTFMLDDNLTLYSNIILEGAGIFATIIDFSGGAYSVLIEGEDPYSTGTVSVTADSTTITGSGTVFTDDMVGQFILIDGDFYEITQRNSNTEIIVSTGFSGATQSGLEFYISTIKVGTAVENLTVQNSSTHAFIIDACLIVNLNAVAIYDCVRGVSVTNTVGFLRAYGETGDCSIGVYFDKVYSYLINTEFIYNCSSDGFVSDEGGDATIFNFGISNCAGRGAKLTNTSKLSFIAFTIDSNTSHGVEMISGCDGNTFTAGSVLQNGGDGIKLTATSDKNSISQIEFSDNTGYGVNIAASTCDNNIITSNVFSGNGSGTVNDSGTGTIIKNNVGVSDNDITEGQPVNGKFVVTVVSNDLVLALKTLAGTDPSPSSPVYIRINGTIRTVTSALSVTKADGTSWAGLGSPELGGIEHDLFIYLGYNTTDGVVIAWCRKNHFRQYGEFSTSTTNESYAAISTTTNAAATDYYTLVGRFAATLSLAGTSHLWTVPTFTAINLIQEPIKETRPLTWTPTWVGYSSNPTGTYYYQLIGSRLFLERLTTAGGTSDAISNTLTAPFKSKYSVDAAAICRGIDNGTSAFGRVDLTADSATITLLRDAAGNTWTNSGSKDGFQKVDFQVA